MNKTFKVYLVLLGGIFILLVFLQLNKAKIIDWRKTFELSSKEPFGLYVLDQEIEGLLDAGVERVIETPYQFYSKDSVIEASNILMINQNIAKTSLDKILSRVAKGDNLMFFSNAYSLNDTLNFKISYYYTYKHAIELLDYKYVADSIYIDKLGDHSFITRIDTSTTKILGKKIYDDYKDEEFQRANFVEIKFGKGKIFIHTEPLFLTNYYLLRKNYHKYAEDVFSYLPKRKTIWFVKSEEKTSQSPMRFILKTPSLRYAWYIILVGLFLFVIFNAKRRQRIVPIIEPNKNTSVDFVKTIGNLYLQEGSNKDMAYKKVTYFLNRVRIELLIETNHIDEVFWRKIQLKTGAKDKDIKKVIPLIEKALHPQAPVQEYELVKLNQLLNKIYN